MKTILVSKKMEETIKKLDNKGMKKELKAIYMAISLLERLDNILNSSKVRKIPGENMYVYKVNPNLRMVFTLSKIEDGTQGYILLDVFNHDDYVTFLNKNGTSMT